MLDLETLGNRPGCVIVAIGACVFGRDGISDEFYERVDVQSCEAIGLHLDADTVLWWLKQSADARAELQRPGIEIVSALRRFMEWLPDCEVWGNGSDFDNTILSAAYHAAKLPTPWKFWNNRCYRTVASLRKDIPLIRGGTHHNALDDAKTQARHLMHILHEQEAA